MSRYKMRNLFKFRTKSTTDLSEWNKTDEKLLKAVETGDVKKATSILHKKTLNPTKLGTKGHSVLHVACAVGHEAIVELLLKYSDDVNDLTIQGNTALQLAAAKGHTAVVQRLLQASGDVDMRDSNDMTALHHACAGIHFECVQVLLNGHASPRCKEKSGKTPLFFAAHHGDISSCKWLVDKGADVNAQDMYNMTPLMLAAKEGHGEVCQFLLKKGASPDCLDREGHTALTYAINNGHLDLREVFARAPTRASWDVHANNVTAAAKTNSDSGLGSPSPPVTPDQVDVVDKFDATESPLPAQRHFHTDDETDDETIKDSVRKTQSESWDSRKKGDDPESSESFWEMADKRTNQALKELEDEHEQLNEDYHNLTLENRKLYDKLDALKLQLSQQGGNQIPQEIEDEMNNVKNLLLKEQAKSRELQAQMEDMRHQHEVATHSRGDESAAAADGEPAKRDSWGDSDEELFDSPTRKRRSRPSPDDKQMEALLRSQILSLRQENEQLKEKMQSTPVLKEGEKPDEGHTDVEGQGSEEMDVLRQSVVRLEMEKGDLEKEILKMKEKAEMELLDGAMNHEQLVVENKRLAKQLEQLGTQPEGPGQDKADGHQDNTLTQETQESKESKHTVTDDQQVSEKEKMSDSDVLSRMEFLETQNEQLRDQCALLTEELEKLRATFDAILKAGDQLQADFDQLQNDKERLQEEFERVVQEKDDMAKENEFLLSDGNALHEDLKKLVHELEKMQEKFKKVQLEKEDLERKTSAINLSGKVGEFTKLLEVRDKLEQRNEELEAMSSRLHHDQEILLEEVQSMQDTIKGLEVERDQLQGDMEEVEGVLQQHEVLQQDYSQLEQDYTELLKDKEKLEQELLDGRAAESVAVKRTSISSDQEDLMKENGTLASDKEQLELTVSELCKANSLLEEELKKTQEELEHAEKRLETGALTNGEPEVRKEEVKPVKPEKSLKIQMLQKQITHLQQQLADFDRQHQDIVSVYRTHLISAVQGHMDPDVKQALHQIIELRSMEQFC